MILKEKNFKKVLEIPIFTRAKDWIVLIIQKKVILLILNKISDSRTSSWNTLKISEDILGVNFIGLNERNNLWKFTEKLISPSKILIQKL